MSYISGFVTVHVAELAKSFGASSPSLPKVLATSATNNMRNVVVYPMKDAATLEPVIPKEKK